MQNEKKELLKKFKAVIDDLMDHYDEYTPEEKAKIGAEAKAAGFVI